MKRDLYAGSVAEAVSPPARGRGLKLHMAESRKITCESPPARGRGLKLQHLHVAILLRTSPPARGRGLKHVNLKHYRTRI